MTTQTHISRDAIPNILMLIFALITALLAPTLALAEGGEADNPAVESIIIETSIQETGAGLNKSNFPLNGMNIYLDGFHPMKETPSHQMEAHHFCRQVNEDFAQCVLFDGNTKDANLNGIEYIISENLFDALPAEEKKYWHPHNYEILSGQLVAPGLPKDVERSLIGDKMNSYGKTWHVWMTGALDGPGDELPLGEPMLAWSFNHDGEVNPGLVERRDRELGINTNELKCDRKALLSKAHPQSGVDAIKSSFPGAQSVPGVTDSGATP